MTVLTGQQIDNARLLTLRAMLKLEIAGLKRGGNSAHTILKRMGYRGTRQEMLAQLDAERARILEVV